MNVLTLTGFFGSGKSAFLIRAARFYTRELGMRIAVIQNEISPNGVDDKQLRADGLVVSELVGGCVCCDLANRLITTLRQVERDLSPDMLLLEASGMATPTMLRHLLDESDLQFDWIRQIALLDASRYHRLERLLDVQLLRGAVTSSDLCLLNKMDLSVPNADDRFRREAKDAGAGCALFTTVLTDSDSLSEDLKAAITPFPENSRIGASAPITTEHHHGPRPAVFADRIEPGGQLMTEERVDCALRTFAAALRDHGCTQVGHIKLFFETGTRSGARANLTDLGAKPDIRGFEPKGTPVYAITLNAIVYGVPDPLLEELTRTLTQELKNEC